MARSQSRYQRGLSYEPGMAESRYRPTRATAELGQIGDYGGVTPIPGETGGGVTAAELEGTGNGLGGGTNMLAGLALSALSNPRVTNWLTDQVRGTGGGGAWAGGAGAPSGGGFDPSTFVAPPYQPPAPPSGPWPAGGEPSGGGWGGVSPDGGASGTDGGVSGLDFGVMDGAEGAGGFGSWLSGLQGTAFTPGATGVEGVLGSGLLGGGFDWLGGAATLGAGALGNWVASQAPYEGRRDPLGKNIGAGLGSAVGGLFLGPFGAFLGAQLGGAIGGQFGPQATVGANWGTLNAYTPGVGWSSHTGADNGGQANPAFSEAFQNALLAYAQQQGMEVNPLNTAMYTVGQYSGNGPNAPGQGYFYQDALGLQRFFGNDLGAQSGGGFGLRPDGTIGTYGDAMLNFAYQDLAGQGFWTPIGTALTGDALQNALTQQRVDAYNGNEAAWAARNAQGAPGN